MSSDCSAPLRAEQPIGGNLAKPSRARRGIRSVPVEILRFTRDTGKPVVCFGPKGGLAMAQRDHEMCIVTRIEIDRNGFGPENS